MAPRTCVLLLALLSGVLFLQAVVADEVSVPAVSSADVVDLKNSSTVIPVSENGYSHDGVAVDGESLDAIHDEDADSGVEYLPDGALDEESVHIESPDDIDDDEEEDAESVLPVTADPSEVDDADEEGDGEEEALSPAHPLARILHSRSSKRCWSSKSCQKHHKKAGCCKKKCVNLASSNKNCGKCGKCCNTKKGYHCASGKCRKHKHVKTPIHGSTKSCSKHKKCAKGYTCCKGKCVKLGGHNENCGKCGNCCKSGFSCKSGKCVKSASVPAQCGKHKKCLQKGHTCCKGKCVNMGYNGHCGRCDNGCDTKKGFHCKSGKCVKSTSTPPKPSPPSPTPSTDSECGDYKTCKGGLACCKGKCVTLSTDNKNCGVCNKVCDTGYGSSCKLGRCVTKPTPTKCGYSKCKPGQTCCHNKCVSLSNDKSNCGHCGKTCDHKKGYCCKSGKCVKPTPTPTECGKSKSCKKGFTCCKGKCVNLKGHNGHCGACGKGCGYGTTCCNGACRKTNSDDRNCGKCGKTCGYGKKCCHGTCVNVFGGDKNNCGACGKRCYTTCKYGMCGYGQ